MASGEIHGRVVSVAVEVAGDELAIDAALASTVLTLTDTSDFDEDGGQCLIDGTVYTYTAVDMDAQTITLSTGLAAAEAAETRVDVYDPDTSNVVSITSALVVIDGQDDGDPVDAEVDHALVPLLEREVRTEGLSVTLVPDGGGFRLVQINGKDNPSKSVGSGTLWQSGYDMGNGTVIGVEAHSAGNVSMAALWLRGMSLSGVGAILCMDETGTFMPIKASAFTVVSDAATKTDITAAPDALSIIADATAYFYRYKTDPDDVWRIGPMANDLPSWLAQLAADGHLSVDLVRQVGVLWAAFGQQIEINQSQAKLIEDLTARVAALEAKQTKTTTKGSK